MGLSCAEPEAQCSFPQSIYRSALPRSVLLFKATGGSVLRFRHETRSRSNPKE